MRSPKVLIIILNYNKKDYLLVAIESVLRLRYDNFDLLVVDNCSSDDSVASVRENFPNVKIHEVDFNSGAAGGRNRGVRSIEDLSPYDYILFLDDDAEVKPGLLGYFVNAMEKDPKAGILCGKAYTNFPPKIIMSCGIRTDFKRAHCYDIRALEEDDGRKEEAHYVDACGGFCLMVRKQLFLDLDMLDEAFHPYGWEDVDFCLRAAKKGYFTKYIPEAILCHKGTRLGRKAISVYESSKVKNYLLLIARHATLKEKFCCLFAVPIRGIKLSFMFIKKGQWKIVPALFEGLFKALFQKRRKET